jgi:RNA polymerase sigma-70 factor (ECF subfamily)
MQPVIDAVDDGALIADSRGRPEAFSVVFDRHYGRVRRYAWARLGAAGEDVAAEAFAIAFARRGDYDTTRSDAAPWLLGIATNLIRRHRREEQRRLQLLAALGGERPHQACVEPATSRIAAALPRLHRRDRDVLVLYAVADLSYAEIAVALGIAEGTVRSRLNRARRLLKETIDQ